MSNQTLYVELNALMDTRIATIESLYGVDVAQQLLENGYDRRESDDWNVLDSRLNTAKINDLYKHHDVTLLANALMSNLVRVLKNFITEANKGTAANPLADPIALHINIAPYSLPEEHRHVLCNSIASHTGVVDVKTINVPRHLATPNFFHSTYKTIFMYDFIDWFTMHHGKLLSQNIQETVWYVPKLRAFGETAQKMETSLDEAASQLYKKLNVWDAATIALTGYMNLQFLDVDAFNIYA